MNSKKYIIIGRFWMEMSLIFLLFSCTEEVDPPDIAGEDLIVVNSIISSSFEQIVVEVSRSQKSFGVLANSFNGDDLITDAVVLIIDENSVGTQLPYNRDSGHYAISSAIFPLTAGKTYGLSVVADNQTLFAQTTVPFKAQKIEHTVNIFEIEISWLDFPDVENYYRIVAQGRITRFEFWDTFDFHSDEFVSDANGDGEKLLARAETFSTRLGYDSVAYRVISSGEIYHDYFKILSNFDSENPFSNPVRLPSNVDNGLGIFAAIQVSEFIGKR
ncbi:MAG: DUF4249 domain-containing protein [Cyclobacteriaceae bacterium]